MNKEVLGQIIANYDKYKASFYKEELYLDSDMTEQFRETIEALLTYSDEELVRSGVSVDELHALLLDDIIFPESTMQEKRETK